MRVIILIMFTAALFWIYNVYQAQLKAEAGLKVEEAGSVKEDIWLLGNSFWKLPNMCLI